MTADHPVPYRRLSAFYFFYFASLGALIPYWGLYLHSRGFTALEIGELVAILSATKIVAPNVWGWIADHTGRSMAIVRVAALVATVAFAGVFFGGGYWWLAAVMSLFSFFWNAALPQFEATTLNHLGKGTHRYSRIRSWGSLGFIVTVAGVGPLMRDYGHPELLPPLLLGLFGLIWLAALTVPERPVHHHGADHLSLREVLGKSEVQALLAACFLAQMSHGPYYTFYTLYLSDHGYSGSATGALWALGVVAEIGIFLLFPRWLPRFGSRNLFLTAMALTTLRWLLIAGFVDSVPVVLFAQLLHAASFGIFHAVAIHLIHRFFPGRLQGRGQALYASLSFGAGGAAGSWLGGIVWEGIGPQAAYLGAAGAAALAFLFTLTWIGTRE